MQTTLPNTRASDHILGSMHVRASCVARDGSGVLITGPAGSGKSGLALRLRRYGFLLVADDIVDVADGVAAAPPALAGLLEVRGLGIIRAPHAPARLALVAQLSAALERLPHPECNAFGVPMIRVRAHAADAPDIVACALDCLRDGTCVTGAFAS